ncbi:MAG: YciI family protein [Candidatus Baltobacteraceae bacterium]
MGEFLYVYRGGRRGQSPEESEQIMQKWLAWMKDLTASGNLKDPGQPLEDEGRVVKDKGRTVTDGPFAETKDLVGGFTLVEADTLARAAELAKGCPILEVDGSVEVRPIMKMDM